MAGDWIKMRTALPRDPRVVRIASALNADRLRTLGGLMSAWCLFDEQTDDGILSGYTPELFDEIVGCPGLARAMESVGWLEIGEGFLAVPRFEEHNGRSAKRRCQEADRKMSARNADKRPHGKETKSGLEKRRVYDTPLPPEGGDQPEKRCLPKNWKSLTRSERKRLRVESNTPLHEKIGVFFGRKPGTLWTIEEAIALHELSPGEEEIDLLARYYDLPMDRDEDYRRRDLLTLLNNWSGEVDRARTHFCAGGVR